MTLIGPFDQLMPSVGVQGQLYRDPDTGDLYISNGKTWFLAWQKPKQILISTPVSGSSFQTFTDPVVGAFQREWLRLNPDGWWPNPYEEERAWADLEAEHELMRVWCEENAT